VCLWGKRLIQRLLLGKDVFSGAGGHRSFGLFCDRFHAQKLSTGVYQKASQPPALAAEAVDDSGKKFRTACFC